MTTGKTRFLAEKLAILDRYEAMIHNGEISSTPDTAPVAPERALAALAQLRQLLLGTLDEMRQQELLEALHAVGIDPQQEPDEQPASAPTQGGETR